MGYKRTYKLWTRIYKESHWIKEEKIEQDNILEQKVRRSLSRIKN
jgi:hypothetical protein